MKEIMRNRKLVKVIKAGFAALFCGLIFAACANANGLHNQQAAEVTFEFINFPESVDGEYAIPGHFSGSGTSWEVGIDSTMIKMTAGNGVSDPVKVSNANIQFSLVKTGDSAWNRSWYQPGILEGNGSDSGVMRNFYIDGLNLSAGQITVVLDGSVSPVTPIEK